MRDQTERQAGQAGRVDSAARPLIRFEGITKRFGQFTALHGVDLDVFEGEFFSLLGPSGCGKTTLLRMLAGFETPDEGRILLAGEDIAGMPPHQRPVNMMFQSYALFPHLDVANNIAFGLKRAGMPAREIAVRVAQMLTLVKLEGLENRKPHQLSGGQRQRVALARALARRPKVLLLDEPMAALDKKLRAETQLELKHLQSSLGLTFIIVTHDQQEAMTLSNRIGVMSRGKLAQVASPSEIYEHPATRYVAEFIGDINMLEATVESVSEQGTTLLLPALAQSLRVENLGAQHTGGTRLLLGLRPEKLFPVGEDKAGAGAIRLAAVIAEVVYLGDQTILLLRLSDGTILRMASPNTRRARGAPRAVGDTLMVAFQPDDAIVLVE